MDFWSKVRAEQQHVPEDVWRQRHFLRNPEREVAAGEAHFLAPADGTILYLHEDVDAAEPILELKGARGLCVQDLVRERLAGRCSVIGIFLSFWDVHYQRMPTAGVIRGVRFPPRRANASMLETEDRLLEGLPPRLDQAEYLLANERTVNFISTWVRDRPYEYRVVQIADADVNVVESHFEDGARLAQGERFGLIRFGSQVDVVLPHPLPAPLEFRCGVGDHVEAGTHILACWRPA